MRVCAVCITHNRAHLLPYLLWCFEQQTLRDKRLLIYDDHGQYDSQISSGCVLISENNPWGTLGLKRNAALRLAEKWFNADAYAVWDDDDFYYPHALEAVAWACDRAAWCRPGGVWHGSEAGLVCHRTWGAEDASDKAYQPGWGFRAGVAQWENVTYIEDRMLARRLLAEGVSECDPCERYAPYLWYDAHKSLDRLSCVGCVAGLKARGGETLLRHGPVSARKPPWPDELLKCPERCELQPRPWGPDANWLEG